VENRDYRLASSGADTELQRSQHVR
jgi:hypothetical protein